MTMLEVNTRKLHLGQGATESEGNLLTERFISTSAYLNAKDNRKKTYYIGHRGAGKSALFQQLITDFSQENNIIVEIRPSVYSYESFKQLHHDFDNIKTTYISAWEYTIYIEVFKKAVEFFEKRRNIKSNRENIHTIKTYLQENQIDGDEDGLSIFIKFLDRYKETKNKLNFKENIDKSFGKDFIRLTNRKDLANPCTALKYISHSFPIYVFIDELDTGWDNSNGAKNFINGLFMAINEIEKQKEQKISMYLSLRKDMYDNLSGVFVDTEKLRSNIERLNWNDELLKAIVAKRIEVSAKIKAETYDELISAVFEEGVLEYILNHTLKRPREVISFCNSCLEKLRQKYRTNDHKKIDLDLVKEVQEEFAIDRKKDFCAEYQYEMPNLESFLNCFQFSNEYYQVVDFCIKIEDVIIEFLEINGEEEWLNEYLINNNNTRKLIDKLFEIGFIKYQNPNDSKFYAYYETRTLKLDKVDKIKINEVFAIALECSNKKRKKIEPITPIITDTIKKENLNSGINVTLITNLISDGDTDKALDYSLKFFNDNQENMNEIILLKSQYSRINKLFHSNMIKLDEYNQDLNKINNSILNLLRLVQVKKRN